MSEQSPFSKTTCAKRGGDTSDTAFCGNWFPGRIYRQQGEPRLGWKSLSVSELRQMSRVVSMGRRNTQLRPTFIENKS